MFVDLSQNVILMTAAAFLTGWLLSSLASALNAKQKAKKRDARDDRIRSLEAEVRVAQSELESTKGKLQEIEETSASALEDIEKRDNVITHQQEKLETLKADLKESVMKTRELRAELSDRATENLKSEVKLREVETELEVAQASTDMIATGVLDYSIAPEAEEREEELLNEAELSKAAN